MDAARLEQRSPDTEGAHLDKGTDRLAGPRPAGEQGPGRRADARPGHPAPAARRPAQRHTTPARGAGAGAKRTPTDQDVSSEAGASRLCCAAARAACEQVVVVRPGPGSTIWLLRGQPDGDPDEFAWWRVLAFTATGEPVVAYPDKQRIDQQGNFDGEYRAPAQVADERRMAEHGHPDRFLIGPDPYQVHGHQPVPPAR